MVAHAAGESYREPPIRGSPVYVVVLAVDSEEGLLRLEQKLTRADIPHSAFREPDPPYNGELMSIGIQPDDRKKLKRYISKYPLMK